MEPSLIEQFITSMSRLKKLESVFSSECEMQINETVSYTHLDVYKRQGGQYHSLSRCLESSRVPCAEMPE